MVNNLAVDSSTMYIGAGHGQEIWKANALTGVVYQMLTYTPALPGPLMDGAFRASHGHLYRANAISRLCETDTEGQVITVNDVAQGGELTGLEFVGDQLYGTNGSGLGSLDSEPAWTFNAIPLSGIDTGPGRFYGGLAYDRESGVLYLAVYNNDLTKLYSVQPDLGMATLISNLNADAGYPSGAFPQAMGWVSEEPPTGTERKSWGHIKQLFK
jgi:hypothetical protein